MDSEETTEFTAQLPEMSEIPTGWIPIDCVTVLKAFNEEGDIDFCILVSDNLTPMETLGMLTTAAAVQKRDLVESFTDDDDD